MNFDRIDPAISNLKQIAARKRFQEIILELGTREDNEHVGSGLGGNNAQLFALMSFRHELVSSTIITIDINNGIVRWSREWLESSSRKAIRHELDAKLPIPRYTPLELIQGDPQFNRGPNVANWAVYLFACNLCQSLAAELDKGNETNIKATALALSGFPMDVCLMSIRKYIQIDRLVRHNLDEDSDFGKILNKINKAVD